MIKFTDDTTVTDNIEDNYRRETDIIVDLCSSNNVFLNVKKPKEIIVEFRRNKHPIAPIYINNETVEQIFNFKFLYPKDHCDL